MASADLADTRKGLSASVAVNRLDAPGGHLQASLAHDAQAGRLEINVTADEPAHGLTAHLLELPNAPPLSLRFVGAGPIDQWRAEWSLSAAQQPFVAGTASIDRMADGGHKVAAQFEGYLETLVPAALRGVLAGKSTGVLAGIWTTASTFAAERVQLTSDALQATVSGGFDPARRYAYGEAAVRLARTDGERVAVPVTSDPSLSLRSLDFRATLPDAASGRHVSAAIEAEDIAGALGSVARVKVTASASQRRPIGTTAFDAHDIIAEASADGVEAREPGLAQAIGSAIEARMQADRSNGTLTVANLRVAGAAGNLTATGQLADGVLSGTAEASLPEVSRFAGLSGRSVAGRAALRADATFDTNVGCLAAFGRRRRRRSQSRQRDARPAARRNHARDGCHRDRRDGRGGRP